MSKLDGLLGNESVRAALAKALSAGTLSHAVLLDAPAGCGRGFAARCLAADYLYPEGGHGADGVMECQCPEMLILAGEGRSGQIPVDRVREVRRDIFHSGLSAAGRVVWIRDAGRMAPPAYNALLKILEEPPADVLFILTADNAASLPDTLRSRCAHYTLTPVDRGTCEAALQKALPTGADSTLPALLAGLYGGRMGLGLAVLKDEDRLAILRSAISIAEAAGRGDTYSLLCLFSAYEGRAEGERERRDSLLFDTEQALAAALRGDDAPGLPSISQKTAAALLPLIADARSDLRRNAAPKITFAALALSLSHPSA